MTAPAEDADDELTGEWDAADPPTDEQHEDGENAAADPVTGDEPVTEDDSTTGDEPVTEDDSTTEPDPGTEDDSTTDGEEPDGRSNWWHIVAVMPLVPLAAYVPGGPFGSLIILAFLVTFPVALWLDARYVRALETEWTPGTGLVAVGALAVLLSLGLLSFVVTPYYLYQRHQHVGTP